MTRTALLFAAGLVLAAAGGQGAAAQSPGAGSGTGPLSLVPIPASAERPFEAFSRMVLAGRDSIVRAARGQVGARYRLGAMQPGKAFDCSGLVKWALSLFGLPAPRTAAQQARLGVPVPRDTAQLLPGDLLYFGRGKRVTHIGIYIGEGRYVHAATWRKGVIESDLARARSSWWKGARRVFSESDSLAQALLLLSPKA